MDERKQEIINRIMKLLNLGDEERNSNPHERELASKKAAQLMAEHSIDFIDLKEGKPKAYEFLKEDIQGYGMRYSSWESLLASAVAKIMDCKIITRDWRHEEGWFLTFVGTKSDIELAVFFFKYLRRTINRLSEGVIEKKASRPVYCYGVIMTVKQRLEELFSQREQFIPSDCKALVIRKGEDLENAFNDMFPNRRSSANRLNLKDRTAYDRGRSDGRDIPLNRPIANNGGVAGYVS